MAVARVSSRQVRRGATVLFAVGVLFAVAGEAASSLSVTPLTWNVIGLDSNSPAGGPNRFPVGARVCTVGGATTATVEFAWDDGNDVYTGDPYINLRLGSLSSISLPLSAGSCADAYFEAEVTRVAAAYDKKRRYHITATDVSGTASSPQPRELFVEHLISQNRNAITDVKLDGVSIPAGGGMSLLVGETYTIALVGGTATQGYNQFEAFINFPNTIFQILSVSTTYSADSAATTPPCPYPCVPNPNDKLYADACGWQNDPNDPNYRSCVGGDYKAGGSNVVTTYTIKVISGGGTSQSLNSLLYDFSGSSFHYNADYGLGARIATIVDASVVTFQKSFSPKAVAPAGTSTLTFQIGNPTLLTFTGVNFTDTLPTGLSVATSGPTATCGGSLSTAAPTTIAFSGGTLGPNSTCSFSLTVTGGSDGSYTNTTGHLFVNTDGDTGRTATDTLTVASTPACTPGQTLATWQMAPAAGTTAPPAATSYASNVATRTASWGGASSDNSIDTSGNPANSWRGQAWPKNATITGDSTPYFQFAIDTSKYSGVTITFDYLRDSNWGGGGADTPTVYAFSSTTGAAGSFTQIFSSTTFPSVTPWASASNVAAAATGSSLTYFRIMAKGSNNAAAYMNIDNIVFKGCGVPTPPPTLSKSFSPDPIVVGAASTLTFSISNTSSGNQALSGVAFSDSLPAGLVVATPNGLTGSCGGGTITATAGSSTVSLSGASLAAGGSCTFAVNVTGVLPGQYTNVSSFISSTESGTSTQPAGYATDTLAVVAPPLLSKAFADAALLTGESTTLSFTLTNPNQSVSLSGIGFTDTLPSGLTVASSGPTSTCGGSLSTTAPSSVAFSGGSLAANSSCTFSVTVAGSSAGTKINLTSVVTSTQGGNGPTATASTVVSDPVALIGLTKQVSTDGTTWYKSVGVPVGGNVYYRFTVSNEGDAALSSVSVTDPQLTMCSLPASLAVGESASCTVGPIAAASGVTTNTATASGTFGAQNPSATSSAQYATTALTVAKSVSPATFTAADQTLTYTYVVTNTGNYPLLGPVSVSDDKATVTCPAVTSVGDGDDYLDPTEAISCTASYQTTADDVTAGSVTNTASATTGGVTSPNDSETAARLVPPTISKSFGAATVAVDDTTSLSFTVTNPNSGNALSGVAFTDSLPAGLVVATPNGLTGTCGGGTITATAGSGTVSLSGATLAASGSCTFSVDVTGTTAGAKSNTTGAVSSTNGGTGGTASDDVTVVAPPSISKSFGAASIALDGTTSLSFTVTNPNSGNALTGVAFTDSLPAGLVVATPNGLTGTCGGGTITATAGSGTVSLSGATLAASGSCTFSVDVTGTTAGAKSNTTGVVSSTNGGTGGTASDDVTVVAPPSISKSFGAASIALDGTTSLSFTVTNPNSGTALTGVAFTDTLPAGLVVATPNGLTGSCGGGTITATAGSGTVSLSGATIAADSSCTFSLDVTGTSAGTKDNTTGNVSSTNGGTGNTASAEVSVASPDLTITKTHDGNLTAGQIGARYTLTVTNVGSEPTDGSTVTVTESAPAGLTVTAMSGTGWTCSQPTGPCSRTEVLNAGASFPSITVTVNVATGASGTVTNVASVSGGGDSSPANNSSDDPAEVDLPAATGIPLLDRAGRVALALLLIAAGALAVNRRV